MVKVAQKKFWKMRQQARLIVANVGASLFLKAQDHTCPICQQRLFSNEITIDHVWPLLVKYENYGNIFLTHYHCNQDKADRLPTDYELQVLDQINERLGYMPESNRYQCRQATINRYHKTAMWLNELRLRNASEKEIERIELKMLGMEEHLGPFVDKIINNTIFV